MIEQLTPTFTDTMLVELARDTRKYAYAPYSRYKVGAACRCENGKTYIGSNVENASYPAGICAERAAVSSAISHGEGRITALALAAGPETSDPSSTAVPCGLCLQFLSEFMSPDSLILIADGSDSYIEHTLEELLPFAFKLDNNIGRTVMTETLYETQYAADIIVEKAQAVLNSGGIIVVPTDTIPGIGCRADLPEAVEKLFQLKNRPDTLPIPVILGEKTDIVSYVDNIPPQFELLADRYWPGQLTIVLESNGKIDKGVSGGKDTIGFRVPDYPLIRSIVKKMGHPLALTSANPHGALSTAVHDKLLMWWNNKVELIVLGASLTPNPPSTVIDLAGDEPSILREGTIDKDELCRLLTCD